jgi:hypothetical protein
MITLVISIDKEILKLKDTVFGNATLLQLRWNQMSYKRDWIRIVVTAECVMTEIICDIPPLFKINLADENWNGQTVYAITALTTVLSDFYGIDTGIISVNYGSAEKDIYTHTENVMFRLLQSHFDIF